MKENTTDIWRIRWVQHLLFWVSIILFFTFLYGSFNDDYYRQFQLQLLYLPSKVFGVYLTTYWLVPTYFFKQKYSQFLVLEVIVIILSGMIQWCMAINVEQPIYYPGEDWGSFWSLAKILKSSTFILTYVLAAFSIKIVRHWFKEQSETQEIIQGQLETELKFLKNQLNPHFLFNTLNNLYALTLKKSDKAPELVLKLSSLMDYMLYECDGERIPLKKEIQFLENYIEVEKLRFGSRLTVNFVLEGSMDGKTIAPLIFLPFLENAFKHGVSANLEETDLDIKVIISSSQIELIIINTHSANAKEVSGNNGIGLQNVKRRLELLYGIDHYDLTIDDNDTYYKVSLKLQDV